MTVKAWLKQAEQQLTDAGIATARLDALVLLGDILNKNSAQVLAEPNASLTPEQVVILQHQIQQRCTHQPLAYLRGKTEFYGREFLLSRGVLEPRPESETMIDMLVRLPGRRPKTVIDVGTGSGALAITAAAELGTVLVYATDNDPHCLRLARRNAKLHGATINFVKTDLLQGLAWQGATIVLANLPYVPDGHTINQAAQHEPRQAIFGGPDGLDVYRRLFAQLAATTEPVDWLLTESLPPQHQQLAKLAKTHGWPLHATDDFIQLFGPINPSSAERR